MCSSDLSRAHWPRHAAFWTLRQARPSPVPLRATGALSPPWHSRMMGSVLSLAHTTAQSEPWIPKVARLTADLQTGTLQVTDPLCFHLMSSVSFHLCQDNWLSRTQQHSLHFLTQKTPECSVTNRPSIGTVGYGVQIPNYFSGCSLKIEPASGGPTPPLSSGDHTLKLTFAGLYMARVGRSAGPASPAAFEDYSIVL